MTDLRQPAPPAPPIPLTGPPFPRAEYEARWAAVAGRMEELGVDAMAVTAPTHLRYLCGYDGSGGYFAPFPLVVAPGAEPRMVCRKYDEDAVRAQSVLTQVATYLGHADFVLAWADALHALRLDRGRVGLELGAW